MLSTPAPAARTLDPALGLRLLYGVVFLFVGGYSNYFSIWLRDAGWDEARIGWIGGVYSACVIAFPLAWGHLTDRWSDPVRVLRITHLAGLVAFLPFIATHAVAPLLGAMFLFAAFRVGVIPAADALTLGHVDRAGGDYGAYRVWGSAGYIVGGFATGLLVEVTSLASVPWTLLATLAGALALVSLLPRPEADPAVAPPTHVLATVRRLWAIPPLRAFYVVTFASRLAAQGLYVFLPLHLQDLGVSAALIPVYWAVGVVAEIAIMRAAPRLFGHLRPSVTLALTFAAAALQFGLMALTTSPVLVLFVMLLHGLSFGLWYYASVIFISRRAPPGERATAQAVFQSLGFGVGGTLSAILSGYVYEAAGGHALFAAAAALALVTLALAVHLARTAGPSPPSAP